MDAKLIFVTMSLMVALCLGDLASDISTNTVELQFYRLQVADWDTHGMQTKVAAILASGANTYCSANPNTCGLVTCCTGTAFKEINIGKDANSAVNDGKNMLFSFYITIPDGASLMANETYVLTSAIIINIVENVRIDVYNSIGYYITWADTTYFGVPPATTENIIITVIAFIVLIIVIVVALFLHYWNKRREHNDKLMKKIEEKKNKKNKKKGEEGGKAAEGSSDGYKMETETGPIPVPDRLHVSRTVTPARKSNVYGGEKDAGASKLPPSKAKGAVSDTDSAIKMDDPKSNGDVDDSRRQAEKSHSLPPLRTSEPRNAEDGEDKKKRKKAKRKHRKSKRTANENAGYQAQSDDEVTDL
ncbi:uncharacterized protein LOC110454880 isoform X2 [Mizuhopecten yessoensis]|uniref:uncharacterized protein LOC110454880 isoform X2 n=1 Tax=Mizuhopecten yessoensis TaxID=6573 RepID=UPI000B45EA55|nr:uncharacterized protein LOC110454880 isoform X2 [Mizuhopecten yessoensis]